MTTETRKTFEVVEEEEEISICDICGSKEECATLSYVEKEGGKQYLLTNYKSDYGNTVTVQGEVVALFDLCESCIRRISGEDIDIDDLKKMNYVMNSNSNSTKHLNIFMHAVFSSMWLMGILFIFWKIDGVVSLVLGGILSTAYITFLLLKTQT